MAQLSFVAATSQTGSDIQVTVGLTGCGGEWFTSHRMSVRVSDAAGRFIWASEEVDSSQSCETGAGQFTQSWTIQRQVEQGWTAEVTSKYVASMFNIGHDQGSPKRVPIDVFAPPPLPPSDTDRGPEERPRPPGAPMTLESLTPWLVLGIGATILGVGAWVFLRRRAAARKGR